MCACYKIIINYNENYSYNKHIAQGEKIKMHKWIISINKTNMNKKLCTRTVLLSYHKITNANCYNENRVHNKKFGKKKKLILHIRAVLIHSNRTNMNLKK